MASHKEEPKIFNDFVHGHIKVPPLGVRVIDTPQFQRLRNIKQIGSVYYVYPGVGHNRFEHCLGVCHLAGELMQSLQRRQPELKISDRDILCVQIAGLCHELGCGPFSHLWDEFIRRVNKEDSWSPETMSLVMFDHLLDENDLRVEFNEEEIQFIRDMIVGKKGKRPFYFYQIISNTDNGIDVDKWEYFARDGRLLNIKSSFDYHRLMEFCEVHLVKGEDRICYRDKEAFNIFEMFLSRASLHSKAYQHKVTKAVDQMIIQAFCYANANLTVCGKDNIQYKLSDAHKDVFAYEKLTDHIIQKIIYSNKSPPDAKLMMQRLHKRNLFSLVGRCDVTEEFTGSLEAEDICDQVWQCHAANDKSSHLRREDLIATFTYFSFGKGKENPFDYIYFYDKSEHRRISKKSIKDIATFPLHYYTMETRHVLVYCKRRDVCHEAKVAFNRWEENKKILLCLFHLFCYQDF